MTLDIHNVTSEHKMGAAPAREVALAKGMVWIPQGQSQMGSEAHKVINGGSHLRAPNSCLRYRRAARQGEAVDTSTSPIGFRCIARG